MDTIAYSAVIGAAGYSLFFQHRHAVDNPVGDLAERSVVAGPAQLALLVGALQRGAVQVAVQLQESHSP